MPPPWALMWTPLLSGQSSPGRKEFFMIPLIIHGSTHTQGSTVRCHLKFPFVSAARFSFFVAADFSRSCVVVRGTNYRACRALPKRRAHCRSADRVSRREFLRRLLSRLFNVKLFRLPSASVSYALSRESNDASTSAAFPADNDKRWRKVFWFGTARDHAAGKLSSNSSPSKFMKRYA